MPSLVSSALNFRSFSAPSTNQFDFVHCFSLPMNLSTLSFSRSTLTSICIRSTHFNFIVNKMKNEVLVLMLDARRRQPYRKFSFQFFNLLLGRRVLGPNGRMQYHLMWLQSTDDDMTTPKFESFVYTTESKHNAIASSRNSSEISFKGCILDRVQWNR